MPVPFFRLNTATVEKGGEIDSLFDFWREFNCMHLLGTSRLKFYAHDEMWRIGDCVFARYRHSPIRFIFRPGTVLQPYIVVSYLRRGKVSSLSDGNLVHLGHDEIHIGSRSEAVGRNFETEIDILLLYVPPERFGLGPEDRLPNRVVPTTTPVGTVLGSTFRTISERVTDCTPAEGVALADAAVALLEIALRDHPDLERHEARGACRQAILRYIEENIDNPALDADHLCARFGMSRATVYRVFNEYGGVHRYVSGRRMRTILSELLRSPARRGIVRFVAERYGYQDMSQFNRLFRRCTGHAPSSVVGMAAPHEAEDREGGNGGVHAGKAFALGG